MNVGVHFAVRFYIFTHDFVPWFKKFPVGISIHERT